MKALYRIKRGKESLPASVKPMYKDLTIIDKNTIQLRIYDFVENLKQFKKVRKVIR